MRRIAWAAAALLLLAGCTSGSSEEVEDPASSPTSPSYSRYVALGDSFTAGPYVPTTDLAQGCLRSNGNYASLVAQRLDVASFVDVSCSGADTRDLRRPQSTFRNATVPAQLDALTEDTDLVTLGIGGNDFDLFGTLLQTCGRLRSSDPSGSPCADYLENRGSDLGRRVARIGDRVASSIQAIRERAPQATILLVGYPRIVPADGTCPRLLPLATGDYPLAERVARALDGALSRAAETTDVGFVEMYAASRGRDVCSDAPWVNGRFTDQTAALAFHPLPAGMDAVADRVVDRLR